MYNIGNRVNPFMLSTPPMQGNLFKRLCSGSHWDVRENSLFLQFLVWHVIMPASNCARTQRCLFNLSGFIRIIVSRCGPDSFVPLCRRQSASDESFFKRRFWRFLRASTRTRNSKCVTQLFKSMKEMLDPGTFGYIFYSLFWNTVTSKTCSDFYSILSKYVFI